MSLKACPSCGKTVTDPTAAFFPVYRCEDCGREYCHKCSGSNGARQCPDCGSKKRREVNRVYA
jgi:DNA-directed RNA polymerase subunit RPC12/RpoP